MTGLFLLGFLLTSASASGVADLVLSCSLLEDAAEGGGAMFQRSEATLVLRDVVIGPEEPHEMLSSFIPPSQPDPNMMLLEATVSSPQIPQADLLLHADCSQQEVLCELSRYSPPDLQGVSGFSHFLVSISIEEAGLSTILILRTRPLEKNQSTLVQSKLGLPLSPTGTLLTEVVFLVFSAQKTVTASLKGDVLLHCGFRQQDQKQDQNQDQDQEVEVTWRLQHRGRGQDVHGLKTKMVDWEGSTEVFPERPGSSVDAGLLVSEGNASLRLTRLRVVDQGSYICSIRVGSFRAQQVIQLNLQQVPSVSLTQTEVNSGLLLSCHSGHYYPLDVQMEWFSLSPGASDPEPLGDQGSLSSHRQHGDGTFSLSAHLTVHPHMPPGTRIDCRVTHRSLDTPLYTSATIRPPREDSYLWVLGFLVVTVTFFYQVMR